MRKNQQANRRDLAWLRKPIFWVGIEAETLPVETISLLTRDMKAYVKKETSAKNWSVIVRRLAWIHNTMSFGEPGVSDPSVGASGLQHSA